LSSDVILEVSGLTKRFGGLVAVNDFDLQVSRSEIRAVIGPNGAGKTTFFNCITGYYKPDKGRVFYKGRDITGLRPHQINKMGISRTFQITSLFPKLTVYENVRVALQSRMKGGYNILKPIPSYDDKVRNILEKIGLYEKRDYPVSSLSHGEQRRLEIGLALAPDAEVLMLDEPTAGMNPIETKETVDLIKGLVKSFGITVILIEHDMSVVMDCSDIITVMHEGKKIAEGKPNEIKKDIEVQRVYLGEV
jgi:branched-chain amino acid transport system ATP-binding protein